MDRVTTLRARFDRNMVCSVSDDYTVRTWDLEMMQEEAVLYGHSGAIKCLVEKDKGSDDPRPRYLEGAIPCDLCQHHGIGPQFWPVKDVLLDV